jgi:signal peptidase II
MQAARGASLNPSEHSPSGSGSPSGAQHFRVIFAAVAVTVWSLDQLTKWLAVEHLTGRGRVDFVGDLLSLHLTRNPGAAFSLGTGNTEVFTALAIVACAVVLYLSPRLGNRMWAVGFGFLLAGVAGNLTDRIFRAPGLFRGHVVDFLELPHWPIFNIADMSLDVAVALIVLQGLRGVRLDGTRHE